MGAPISKRHEHRLATTQLAVSLQRQPLNTTMDLSTTMDPAESMGLSESMANRMGALKENEGVNCWKGCGECYAL
ncbi:MAG: hypothetical protein ACK4ZC_02035 [Bacteroidota bacterium]